MHVCVCVCARAHTRPCICVCFCASVFPHASSFSVWHASVFPHVSSFSVWHALAPCSHRVRINVCVCVRFYEERERRMLEVRQEQERFKRAGKEWKEEIKPHVSTAVVPPAMALPAAIAGCWVGGTALPAKTQPEYPIDF